MADLIERLNNFGRNAWGSKDAYVTFPHYDGMVHLDSAAGFFRKAVNLAEEAAAEIASLKKELTEARIDRALEN